MATAARNWLGAGPDRTPSTGPPEATEGGHVADRFVRDCRRRDFSILDDEVQDDYGLDAFAQAAYWAIVRHARFHGQTDEPSRLLQASAGISTGEAWRSARTRLEAAGLIKVEQRDPPQTFVITLLPVSKARLVPPGNPTTTPSGGNSGVSSPRNPTLDTPESRLISSSEIQKTIDRSADGVGGQDPEKDTTGGAPSADRRPNWQVTDREWRERRGEGGAGGGQAGGGAGQDEGSGTR